MSVGHSAQGYALRALHVRPSVISFVIPAHNEEALIGATIEALVAGAAPLGTLYEIVVVDDSSTDRTAEIARASGARVVPVRLRQIAAVRNAGAAAASGDLLLFVDADTIVPAATLRRALDAVRNGAIAGGAHSVLPPSEPRWARVTYLPLQWAMIALRLPGGAFMFTTRQAFDAAGGFDERYFASEEILFARTLKKLGPFRMIRPGVVTSGRKFRLIGGRRLARQWFGLLLRGPGVLKDRKHLGIWYDKHRD